MAQFQRINSDPKVAQESKRAGRLVLIWLLAFFAVFATVDAIMIFIAVNSFSGEVVSSEGPSAKSKPVWKKSGD